MKMKKVYFAGSIRGGRVDAELYKRIIQNIILCVIVEIQSFGGMVYTVCPKTRCMAFNEGVSQKLFPLWDLNGRI